MRYGAADDFNLGDGEPLQSLCQNDIRLGEGAGQFFEQPDGTGCILRVRIFTRFSYKDLSS